MKWWNDLWLNESFATYVSYLCMHVDPNLRKQSPHLWCDLLQIKDWAYSFDNLASTHPIMKNAVNTDMADDMVNGITYGKGSSYLKQLYHLIGNDTFSQGCKNYFNNFKWKNTELMDFLGAL